MEAMQTLNKAPSQLAIPIGETYVSDIYGFIFHNTETFPFSINRNANFLHLKKNRNLYRVMSHITNYIPKSSFYRKKSC